MDGYQLIADLFKSLASLAWPAAFVIAVLLFRRKLMSLLPLMRLKYKDFDVSFRLDEAEKDVDALPAPPEVSVPTPEETDKFRRLVRVSPRAAILERRLELQEALETFANSVGIKVRGRTVQHLTRDLRTNDLIDEATSALLDSLRAVGNTAAHDAEAEISENDAIRFGKYTDRLIEQLQIATAAAHMPPPLPLRTGP